MKKFCALLVTLGMALGVILLGALPASATPQFTTYRLPSYSDRAVVVYGVGYGNGHAIFPNNQWTGNPPATRISVRTGTDLEIKQADCNTLLPIGPVLQSYRSNGQMVGLNQYVLGQQCVSIYTNIPGSKVAPAWRSTEVRYGATTGMISTSSKSSSITPKDGAGHYGNIKNASTSTQKMAVCRNWKDSTSGPYPHCDSGVGVLNPGENARTKFGWDDTDGVLNVWACQTLYRGTVGDQVARYGDARDTANDFKVEGGGIKGYPITWTFRMSGAPCK